MDEDRIPLSISLFPGNANEQTSLKPLEKKVLGDLGFQKFVYCSDAGLGSESIREYDHMEERAQKMLDSGNTKRTVRPQTPQHVSLEPWLSQRKVRWLMLSIIWIKIRFPWYPGMTGSMQYTRIFWMVKLVIS